jgi:hypothetical protein
MSGQTLVSLDEEAAAPSPVRLSPAPARLLITVVNPRPEAAVELAAFVRDALPKEVVVAAPRAVDALARAQSAARTGQTPGVFIFDFRGLPVGDLAGQVRIMASTGIRRVSLDPPGARAPRMRWAPLVRF